ncbi:MAG TPA: A24 family peptidase [Vulgatibacter sp.]
MVDLAPLLLLLLLAGSLGVSLVTDLRRRLILDVVTYPTLGLSLAVRAALVGWDGPLGLWAGLLGAAVGLVVLLPAAWRGGMGMGDVKLAGAVGAAVGFERIFGVLFWIAIAGGVLAFAVAVKSGTLGRTLKSTARVLLRREGSEPAEAERVFLPYGVAIVAGTALSLVLEAGASW